MSLIREIQDRLVADRDGLEESVSYLRGDDVAGHARVVARGQRLERAIELAELIADINEGRRHEYWLMEALSTSDFPLLFGFVLERILLDRYENWPQTWPQIARRRTAPDFRNIELVPPSYGGGTRLEAVHELDEYKMAPITEQARITYKVGKFGRRVGFSFELGVGDALGQLENIPNEFGQASRETENYLVTELHVDANGPHASLYTVGNANIVTGNPALSVAGLQTAMQVLAAMKDEQGRPIFIRAVTLVVPPALEIVARNIINATEIRLVEAGGTTNQLLVAQNWMRNRVNLVVDPYIPLVATSANGNTSWFLFADPQQSPRPALEIAFLRGHERPEVWVKSPNAQRIGGGDVNPLDGDFEHDSIAYRIRHIVGGVRVDPKVTVASQGDGT